MTRRPTMEELRALAPLVGKYAGTPGTGPVGTTCKTCAHLRATGNARKRHPKCGLTPFTSGDATTIRTSTASYDTSWQRDIGYGVPAYCDHPGCTVEIDRGVSYVCAEGCGLHFCGEHLSWGALCERCEHEQEPFDPKPDHPEWIRHKLTDKSWAVWRAEHPKWVKAHTPERAGC